MKSNLYIVIVGCGRVGADLANELSREGHAVVVIDRNPSAFAALSPVFSGFRIEGDASHFSVLKEAKLSKADVLIATTHEDNVNLMVAQLARKVFQIPQVAARVYDPRREELYAKLGIETICPTRLATSEFLTMIRSEYVAKNGKRL
ncbi:MAG: TrkA family potassium uptake protein [Desulfobacteraceae bacterium]|nr:MAG: TrkA family potassium uptake protein [Desulfobacteraceae bacterium]